MTKSSTAAEYVALSDVVSEIKVMLNLLSEFHVKIQKPVRIYEDNSGAIAIAEYVNMTNSKYFEVHDHYVNECYESGVIDIVKVESEKNLAYLLIKALGRMNIKFFKQSLRMI